jgi:phosphohistidine swiveling domain-containing protein
MDKPVSTGPFVVNLKDRSIPVSVGSKAFNLRKLMDHGIRIPVTFVCTWDAYHRYIENDDKIVDTLRDELARVLEPDKYYAIRSSANIEDSIDRSFAGQFRSVLNVQGVDNIIQSIWSIWATATSPAVQSYLERRGIITHDISMAVIIQEMVLPVVAGVALSRNPVTGADEIVVEAVHGSGEALVQSGVTPSRWVYKSGGWLAKPDGQEIPLSLAEQVVTETSSIAKTLKSSIDLEWAWNGKELYWLQVRAITTLNKHNIYSNHMSKEMLPGMIKPLIWSVNIPMKSKVFVQFMDEMLGDTKTKPEELIKSFYYRVYFNMGVIGHVFEELGLPADSLEIMMGVNPMGAKMSMKPTLQMLRRLPHMMAFAHDKWMFHRKMRIAMPDLERRSKAVHWQEAGQMSETELLTAIEQLYPFVQEVAYYNILCPILSGMHNRMLDRELKRLGIDPVQLDITENLPGLAEYDPSSHLRTLNAAFEQLEPQVRDSISNANHAQFKQLQGIANFQQQVAAFIELFGHLSDNGNDFSWTPWREDPDMVLRLIIEFKPVSVEKAEKIHFSDLKINFLRRPMVKLFFERARQYLLLREQLSSLYTYTYGLFRNYYLALGGYLVKRGAVENVQDIFYLSDAEIRQIIAGHAQTIDRRIEIAQHKDDMERFREISLPTIIYGDEAPPIENQSSRRLTGLVTSIGHYTGTVKVIHGIQDFNKVKDGDVIIIPYSDVGWMPLFAHAGAVVAESGGLLSHSSIIAREYGIPAVVSVKGAMSLLDDMRVTVDAHKGEVIILQD